MPITIFSLKVIGMAAVSRVKYLKFSIAPKLYQLGFYQLLHHFNVQIIII